MRKWMHIGVVSMLLLAGSTALAQQELQEQEKQSEQTEKTEQFSPKTQENKLAIAAVKDERDQKLRLRGQAGWDVGLEQNEALSMFNGLTVALEGFVNYYVVLGGYTRWTFGRYGVNGEMGPVFRLRTPISRDGSIVWLYTFRVGVDIDFDDLGRRNPLVGGAYAIAPFAVEFVTSGRDSSPTKPPISGVVIQFPSLEQLLNEETLSGDKGSLKFGLIKASVLFML